MTRRLCAVLALATIAIPAPAVEDSDVLFFAPFEDVMDAAVARGEPSATVTGEPQLVAGVRGRAVLVDAASMLSYAFEGSVVPDEGTVMMWFRPDWPADDGEFHFLFHATTGNDRGKALNALYVYKYGRWGRLMFYTSNGEKTGPQQGRSLAYKNDMSWEPGTWHHIAATWSSTLQNTEMYLYFDGERIAACGGQVFVPDQAPETFELGEEGVSSTAFDDVLVFSRPLLEREIQEIYGAYQIGDVADATELPFVPRKELHLRPFVNFPRDHLVVLVDYRGARRELGDRPGEVEVTVEGAAGGESGSAATDEGGVARVELDYRAVGAGPVTIDATLRDGEGDVIRSGRLQWAVPERPDWLGNRLGVTDEVLPPWTPVRAAGDAVSVWGREYAFGRSPLPAQVTSQSQQLLRGPIELRAGAAGLVADPVTGIQATDTQASRGWKGAVGPLACEATTSVEFDGFVRVDLELTPPGTAALDELQLVVPLREDAATLYHHCVGEWTDLSDAGATSEAGWSKTLPFVPYVWLGNESAGLAWWCESAWNWRNADPDRAVEIVHGEDGVDLILRFIDGPTRLFEPLRLTFGFLATPVKPLPDGWRDWRPMFISATDIDGFAQQRSWIHEGCRDIGVLWATHVGRFSYFPADPEEMARKIATLHEAGWQTMVSYYAVNSTQTGTPEYELLEREWRRNPYSEAPAAIGNHGSVCQASSWADMLLTIIDRTMDQTGTDGVYLDCSSPRFCRSAEHGCGHGRWPLLATRELQKRLYALVKQKRGDNGFVYSHVSESVFMTTYTYSDAILNGEQYNRKDLLTDLTLEKFRAEFLPHSIGVPQILLPTLVKFQPEGQEKMPGQEFLALPLLHDVITVPPWMSRESQQLLRSIQHLKHEFGVGGARFLPYWSNEDAIGLSAEGALVSAYHRQEPPGLLLIAQAPSEEPVELEVALIGDLAGLSGAPARDALTGEDLGWRDGRLVWPLPGRAVQLAIIER